jgi:hypothetical protein
MGDILTQIQDELDMVLPIQITERVSC